MTNQHSPPAPNACQPAAEFPLRTFLIVLPLVLVAAGGGMVAIRQMTPGLRSSDLEKFYRPAAEAMLEGKAPVIIDGSPMTNVPIGFPVYMMGIISLERATGIDESVWVLAGNLAATAALLTALSLFTWRFTRWRPAALLAVVAVGLYPLYLYLAKQALPQVVYLPLAAWGLYMIHGGCRRDSWWRLAVAGLLLGLGGLVRPAVVPLLLGILLYLLVFARGSFLRRLARPALVLGLFVLTVLPWEIHVCRQAGRFVLLSDAAGRSGVITASGPATVPATAAGEDDEEDAAAFGSMKDRLKNHLSLLIDDPAAGIALIAGNAGKAWYASRSGRHQTVALAVNIPYMVLIPFGLVVALRRRGWRWPAGLAFCCLLVMWALSTMTVILARLTLTGIVLAGPLAAVAAAWLLWRLGVAGPPPDADMLPVRPDEADRTDPVNDSRSCDD